MSICALVMSLYVIYDGILHNGDDEKVAALLAVRFGGIVPCCLLLLAFTFTKFYWWARVRMFTVTVLLIALGACIVIYSSITANGGYGVPALFFIVIHTFTPLHIIPAAFITLTMSVMYLPVLQRADEASRGIHDDDWFRIVRSDYGTGVVQDFSTMLLFGCLCLYFQYKNASLLRLDFVENAMIKRDREQVAIEQELSDALLQSMLPQSIIALEARRKSFCRALSVSDSTFC